jgi:hypothetical protein
MSEDQYAERKRLTFAQAEGVEPLATQLETKQLSKELRALLWAVIYGSMDQCRGRDGTRPVITDPWRNLLLERHVFVDHEMADEFNDSFVFHRDRLKTIFANGDHVQVLGFAQWLLRNPKTPPPVFVSIPVALKQARAAYVVVGRNTIVPIASDQERQAIDKAFADVATTEFGGARSHLRNAATELTAGRYPESVRESIHAVESVARVLDPSANTLDPALATLARSQTIHPALRAGFGRLYGFTNDEEGIRHPLLDEPVAAVDEADALYMLGSCASFASYLINKARQNGLLDKK